MEEQASLEFAVKTKAIFVMSFTFVLKPVKFQDLIIASSFKATIKDISYYFLVMFVQRGYANHMIMYLINQCRNQGTFETGILVWAPENRAVLYSKLSKLISFVWILSKAGHL